jgi:hypothetical protein
MFLAGQKMKLGYIGIHEKCKYPSFVKKFLQKYPTEDNYINKAWAKDYKKKMTFFN